MITSSQPDRQKLLPAYSEDDDDDLSLSSYASDNDSNHDHESSSGGNEESTTDRDFREVRALTRKETKHVETWRDLVTGILVITASFITMASFIYLSHDETQTFKMAFNQYIITINDAAVDLDSNLREGFASVSEAITAHAQSSGSQWPLVTVPFFEKFGSHARDVAHVDFFSFCPLVNNESTRTEWEAYSVDNQWWTTGDQVVAYTEVQENEIVQNNSNNGRSIPESIYQFNNKGHPTTNLTGLPPYGPRWQISPPPSDLFFVNYNVLSGANMTLLYDAMIATNGRVLSKILPESHSTTKDLLAVATVPSSLMLYPVYETFNQSSSHGIVGFLEILVDWKTFISLLLPEGEGGGVYYVLNNDCDDQQHTFERTMGQTIYLGEGDRHDIIYDRHVQTVSFFNYSSIHMATGGASCSFSLDVYPSAELRREFSTNIPGIFTAVIAGSFFLMAGFFFTYDKFVQHRNEKVIRQAAKTNAIVSSLFPTNVRDRLFGRDDRSVRSGTDSQRSGSYGKSRLKSFLSDNTTVKSTTGSDELEDRPIADLFPNCTVLFADIVGFTAWSSMREPTQVFRLLEKIYKAFDDIAKRRKVFKVETIGDCYVAVTGLPEPNKLHALVMAKFARECMYKMHEVTRQLEVSLGPDTGDLSMRFGFHSGPVTAGVLRGERSRFQLFGDTVNTAARMESTGKKGCIHVSQEAADEITTSGKGSWIRERADKVTAKGKGKMTTFWLSLAESSSGGDGTSSCGDILHANDGSTAFSAVSDNESIHNPRDKESSYYATRASQQGYSAKNARLVEWNVDILSRLLKQIEAKRQITEKSSSGILHKSRHNNSVDVDAVEKAKPQMVLDEVSEVITLPKFTSKVAGVVDKADQIVLTADVQLQLFDFVSEIASMYHENSFHNFEHASHVTMSVVKLLSRIVAPDLEYDEANITNERKLMRTIASKMHDHTYGITSDPLTQFSVVLSALIHDVDHLGVPNVQLVKEGTETAKRYKGKSVAEQNSVDLSWALLMKPAYKDLRKAICNNDTDWKRFRQLVVNSVMATDIADKELKELRNARWAKAFNHDPADQEEEEDVDTDRNRKATIVIDHLIQASDISHTMQHWHIYRKWNERLFRELYLAYIEGRADKDPSEFWYKGEIGFFQFYIIPLAKKLKECGVFGVSSDEYLNYAEQNLSEWKSKGEEVVDGMIKKVKEEFGEVNPVVDQVAYD